MAKPYSKLGEILLKEGFVTQEALAQAIDLQKKSPSQFLGDILLRMGAVSEPKLAMALGKQMGIPFVSLDNDGLKPLDASVLGIVPEEFARRHTVLPLKREANFITVAMADPQDLMLRDNLQKISGFSVRTMIATATDLRTAIDRYYGEGGLLKSAVEASYRSQESEQPLKVIDEDEPLSLDNIVASAEKAPVIHFTDLLIRQAIKGRASDIHIEPFEDHVSIRLRIDGVLHEIPPPAKSMVLPLISRLKIISKMDISEKRLPQDGSFRTEIEDRFIDFRVSTIPTLHGEKMVLRILDRSTVSLDLTTLGFDKEELEFYRKVIRKPYGLILITGPTGSGKTTTLYGALNELKGADKNILTIEDPVEYQIPGVNQVQIKPSIGLTFARGLRAFLRQDPDIILVGEIRDLETAQICVKAALTGHLVFSTLHTNDAPGAINRLIDIGVEPFFVVSSLIMVGAQRLVRTLCPKCKEAYKPNPELMPEILKGAKQLYRAKGCDACSKTGYFGRAAIFEIMSMSESIEELISKKATLAEIRAEARRSGMRTLEESGYKKVLAGLTSFEEVTRITMQS